MKDHQKKIAAVLQEGVHANIVAEKRNAAEKAHDEFLKWLKEQPWFSVTQPKTKFNWLENGDLFLQTVGFPTELHGKGYGKSILAKLKQLSDQYQIPITLEADETGNDADWLQDWYCREGFEYHDNGIGEYGPYMVRYPI